MFFVVFCSSHDLKVIVKYRIFKERNRTVSGPNVARKKSRYKFFPLPYYATMQQQNNTEEQHRKKPRQADEFIDAVYRVTMSIMEKKGKNRLTEEINTEVRGMFASVKDGKKQEVFSRSQLQRWITAKGQRKRVGRTPYLNSTDQEVLNEAIRHGCSLGIPLVPRRVDEMVCLLKIVLKPLNYLKLF